MLVSFYLFQKLFILQKFKILCFLQYNTITKNIEYNALLNSANIEEFLQSQPVKNCSKLRSHIHSYTKYI
jgi:hypothetical protein